jgi:hypothetical protein
MACIHIETILDVPAIIPQRSNLVPITIRYP